MDTGTMAANVGAVDVAASESPASSIDTTAATVAVEHGADTVKAEPTAEPTAEPKTEAQPHEEKITKIVSERIKKEQERIRAEYEEKAKSEQAKRDAQIASQGYEWNGQKITTEADYYKALEQKAKLDEYQAQGLSEEAAKYKVELDELKAAQAARESEAAAKAKQQQDAREFFDYFRSVNGRDWNPEAEPLPQEVFDTAEQQKIPLKFAYAEYTAKQFKAKLTGLDNGQKTAQANAANASSSTGSVNGNGAAAGVITEADINAHAYDRAWMMKNYKEVQKVLTKKG